MAEASDQSFLELMKQGWIAGYPPWFHNFWIKPAKCKTEEEKTRLLNFLRAIEDGKMEEMKWLLPDVDPKLRLAVEGTRTESLLEWAVEKAERIVAILEEAGLSESASQSELPEQADFSERAKSPEFKSALMLAKKLTKSAPEPVELETGELDGVPAFKFRDKKKALDILEEIRPELAALGAYAFLSEGLLEYDSTYLVLIPERDYRKAIIAFETPVGQSVDCHDLNKWLKKLEEKEPFVITHIAPDLVRARFSGKLKDSNWVARQIHEICSDAMDSPVPQLAKHLEKSGELFLWWD